MVSFVGTGVAVITPFNHYGEIDFPALKNLIDHLIENGIDYLVALGTTAESATLSNAEKHEVIKCFVNQVNGRVPIVLGAGGNNTKVVLNTIDAYDTYPVQGFLMVCPYYNKPNQAGLEAHFSAIAEHSNKAIILYNVPGRTCSNLLPETVVKLSQQYQNIVGIKEASGSIEQSMHIVQNTHDDFIVISGEDALTLPLMAIGARGVISVTAQGFPKLYSQMVQSALQGNFAKARENHYHLLEITQLLFAEGNPAGIKALLHYQKAIDNALRLPLVPTTENLAHQIGKAAAALNNLDA